MRFSFVPPESHRQSTVDNRHLQLIFRFRSRPPRAVDNRQSTVAVDTRNCRKRLSARSEDAKLPHTPSFVASACFGFCAEAANCNAHLGSCARARAMRACTYTSTNRAPSYLAGRCFLRFGSTATVNCRLSTADSAVLHTREVSCNCRLSIVDCRYHSGGIKEKVRESGLGCCE